MQPNAPPNVRRQATEHLRRAIELGGDRFQLLVATVPGRMAMEELARNVDPDGSALRWPPVPGPVAEPPPRPRNLLTFLNRALFEERPRLLVVDTTGALPGDDEAWGEVFRRLNEHRDNVAARWRAPLLLALPPRLLPVLVREAPDLWSVRSAVVRLPPGGTAAPPAEE